MTKLLVKSFVSYLLLFLNLCSVLTVFLPLKHTKIITGLLNGCAIVCIGLFPLEYILRFRTKFITKVLFWRFLNIFKFLFTSNNFCTPTTIQNYHRSLKELLHQGNLVLLSKKSFNSVIFVIFWNAFKVTFSFNSRTT